MIAIVTLGSRLVGRQAGNVSQAEKQAGWHRVEVGRGLSVWWTGSMYVCLTDISTGTPFNNNVF